MNKINGYTEAEATGLVDYIYTGRNEGKTLSYLFETYGREHSRAKGSVRNYYYALLKQRNSDSRVYRLLEGKNLFAGEIKPFSEEETDEMLKKVLAERKKGVSVRRAIRTVAGGDEKLMLRIQNKYRNLLKKQPERVRLAQREAGIEEKPLLQRRLEREIDELYARLQMDLKSENERLRAELEKLRSEKEE